MLQISARDLGLVFCLAIGAGACFGSVAMYVAVILSRIFSRRYDQRREV